MQSTVLSVLLQNGQLKGMVAFRKKCVISCLFEGVGVGLAYLAC